MAVKDTKIAYFSAEIGISDDIPTYSGGLGVLAGDHIKASADAGLSMGAAMHASNIKKVFVKKVDSMFLGAFYINKKLRTS